MDPFHFDPRTIAHHYFSFRLFYSDKKISTVYEPFTYNGKYISGAKIGNRIKNHLVNKCSAGGIDSQNVILRVKCPDVCGARINFETEKPNQNMRITGGKEAAPGSHPWLVSLHLNGRFLCGGNIIGQKWVIHLTLNPVTKCWIYHFS